LLPFYVRQQEKGYVITELDGTFEFTTTDVGIFEIYTERDLISNSKFINVTEDKTVSVVNIVFQGESLSLSAQEIKGQRRNDIRLYAGSIQNTNTKSIVDKEALTPTHLGINSYTLGGKGIRSNNLGIRGTHPNQSRGVHIARNGFSDGILFHKQYNEFLFGNEAIEITKASASNTFAPYTTAGVVNKICCQIEDTIKTELRGEFSSTIGGALHASHSGWGNDKLKGLIQLDLAGGETYHEDLPFYKGDIAAEFEYKPDPEHQLNLSVNGGYNNENTLTGHTAYSAQDDPFGNFKQDDVLEKTDVSIQGKYKKIFSSKLASSNTILHLFKI